MKINQLSIGQMAELNHTTVNTLRLYDRMGILKPAFVNPDNGYRYYDIRQCSIFRAIQYNKNLGINLKDIQDFVEASDYDIVENTYREKLGKVKVEITAMEEKRQALERTLRQLRHFRNLPPPGTTTIEYFDEQYKYEVPARYDYFKEGLMSYERGVSAIMGDMIKNHFPDRYCYFTGVTLKKGIRPGEVVRADTIFMYVSSYYLNYEKVTTQPDGLYACVYFDDFDKRLDYIHKLHAFSDQMHCIKTGPVHFELIGSLDKENFEYFKPYFRLGVPVRFIHG